MVKHLKLRFWGELLFEHNNRTHADFAVSNLLFEHKIQKQILPSLILILPLLMFSLKFVGNHKYPDIIIKIQISQPNTLTRKKQTNKQTKNKTKSGHEFNTDVRTWCFEYSYPQAQSIGAI